jgi:hypothetical protein
MADLPMVDCSDESAECSASGDRPGITEHFDIYYTNPKRTRCEKNSHARAVEFKRSPL